MTAFLAGEGAGAAEQCGAVGQRQSVAPFADTRAGAANAAAREKASPPLAPARTTGEITDAEKLFQGDWQPNNYGSDSHTGSLHIDHRAFRADTVHGSYVGHVSIRSDTSPARIDFTIQDCNCKFDGMTSTAIYYEDGGTIPFAAPAPGEPRPKEFTGLDETRVLLQRATRLHPLQCPPPPDPATEDGDEKPR